MKLGAATVVSRYDLLRVAHGSTRPSAFVDTVSGHGYIVNITRKRHSKKQIEEALQEAEAAGLTVTDAPGRGHSTHIISGDNPHPFLVWSTPKNPDNHVKQIRRHIARNI